jgi:hypothetical protein
LPDAQYDLQISGFFMVLDKTWFTISAEGTFMSKLRGLKLLSLALLLAPPVIFTNAAAVRSEEGVRQIFRVMLDEARILRLDTPAQTLVLGNAAIADAVVSDGKTVIITGKSFGTTNLIALNRNNEIIAERQIQVQQPESSILVVQRAGNSESYSCAPKCKPTPILGDEEKFFSGTISQSSSRNGWAQGGGAK